MYCNIVARSTHTVSMEPFTVTRLAHDGCDPSDTWTVVGIGHSKIDMEKVNIMNVSTIAEYEAGCQEHTGEKCLGHLCRTPYGNILPMQSLAVSTGVITNDVSKAARFAFEGAGQYYFARSKDVLLDSMKKKTGRMRKGVLNCHIDGSLRMVITPQLDLGKEWVAVPRYLLGKWSVVYFDENCKKYRSKNVEDGDYAIAVRPPSLSIKSVQPVRITFWNETCLGISPYILKAFDGDYDGDEMHVFPVYSRASIQECAEWTNTPNLKFDKAAKIYAESKIADKGLSQYSFMDHTTMSFDEIRLNAEQPILAEETRTTSEHIQGFRNRYDTKSVNRDFIAESIRGMGDTNAQQLSQPIVGVMSRIAKLAASCVIHSEDDSIFVATRTSLDFVCKYPQDKRCGNSAMRGISTMCAGIQQIALESHHAKKKSLPSHDMVSEMMEGSDFTLVILDGSLTQSQIQCATKAKWLSKFSNENYILCKPESIASIPRHYIKGSYNPIALSFIEEPRRLDVCKNAISKVVQYYEFTLSETEIHSLAVLFSYKTELSKHPISTRDGMKDRNLRWTEVVMANHYTELRNIVDSESIGTVPVDSVSSRLMSGNFLGQ